MSDNPHIGSSFEDYLRTYHTQEEIDDIYNRAISGVMMSFNQYEMAAARKILERTEPANEAERGIYRMFFTDENDIRDRESRIERCPWCFKTVDWRMSLQVADDLPEPYANVMETLGDYYYCSSEHLEADIERVLNESRGE